MTNLPPRRVMYLLTLLGLSVLVGTLIAFLLAIQVLNTSKPSPQVTTEGAAATAGARVSPTEPKLRIEPK